MMVNIRNPRLDLMTHPATKFAPTFVRDAHRLAFRDGSAVSTTAPSALSESDRRFQMQANEWGLACKCLF
jgi:hypothetical protein